MQIQINNDNLITGYAVIGEIENGIEVDKIPKEVLENCRKYKYIKGEFIFDDSFIKTKDDKINLQAELQSILKWFADTDYICNKVIRGNWQETDERFIEYKAEYLEKYERKEEIENLLEVL